MDLKQAYPDKVMDAETAVSKIKNGSRVFIGTGCGEPQHLIRTMVEDLNMQDIMVYQMLSRTFSNYVDDPQFLRRFSLKLFFISSLMRKAAFEAHKNKEEHTHKHTNTHKQKAFPPYPQFRHLQIP